MPDARFDLDAALSVWRRRYEVERTFSADDLEELEGHVRDHVTALVGRGWDEEAAFHEAVRKLGDYDDAARAYRDVRWAKAAAQGTIHDELIRNLTMFKNHLRLALRHLGKRPGYAAINAAGLAVGLACVLLIGLYVADELTFDRFHADADRIYRLVEASPTPEGELQWRAWTAPPVRQVLLDEVPGTEGAVRALVVGRANVRHGENWHYEGDYLFVDSTFFDVFSYDFLRGDPATALARPGTVVLTETAARKYFGDEDPMGQTLEMDRVPGGVLRVTGILRDLPSNDHLDFSMLVPLSTLTGLDWWADQEGRWASGLTLTYVKLAAGVDPARVEADLNALAGPRWAAADVEGRRVALQPLADVHFGSAHITDELNRGENERGTVYAFLVAALFVLLIACINYVNLATARSAGRAKEVGVRKVVGARRGELVRQFLTEAALLTVASLVLGAGLALAALPAFNAVIGKALGAAVLRPEVALLLIGLAVVLTLLAGGYPALYLSGFRPARALQGVSARSAGPTRVRRVLVAGQFVLSIGLVAATLVVFRQLDYVQERWLGFDQEHVVVVDINSGTARSGFRTMKAEMAKVPEVVGVTTSSRVPGEWKDLPRVTVQPEATDDRHTAVFLGVDEDFLDVYRIPLAAGRTFSAERPADSAAVLVNEAAVRAFGWTDPVGRTLGLPDVAGTYEVIGVVEDFHVQSLHETIAPLVLGHRNNAVQPIDYFSVRVRGGDLAEVVAGLEAAHYRVDPETIFELNFLDRRLADFYERDVRMGRLVGGAAGLAILVACLGLVGLAAFTAEQRTKEVGIRKVLGATTLQIAALLTRDVVVLVGVAFVVAAPLAWWGTRQWLSGFAYHVDPGAGVFLLAGAAALAVAALAVSVQALRAALANPADALRYE